MQTHEATDMLIRSRVPDTSLHVVLWQVGLIGEMGFRRKGYINENFSVFVRYLQQHYGDDYPVTHYIASRFPTVPPTIEVYPLATLHDPVTQAKVTGISTFYLPPRDTGVPDVEMLVKLGLLEPGQTPRPAAGPLREIGRYSTREHRAFKAFRSFKVPPGYHWQDRTAASRFVIALRTNQELAEQYRTDPRAALSDEAFADLTDRERALLAMRDPGAIQVAAKGTLVADGRNCALLHALFAERPLLRSLMQVLRDADPGTLMERQDQEKARSEECVMDIAVHGSVPLQRGRRPSRQNRRKHDRPAHGPSPPPLSAWTPVSGRVATTGSQSVQVARRERCDGLPGNSAADQDRSEEEVRRGGPG